MVESGSLITYRFATNSFRTGRGEEDSFMKETPHQPCYALRMLEGVHEHAQPE